MIIISNRYTFTETSNNKILTRVEFEALTLYALAYYCRRRIKLRLFIIKFHYLQITIATQVLYDWES
jgi:hypothetical protein